MDKKAVSEIPVEGRKSFRRLISSCDGAPNLPPSLLAMALLVAALWNTPLAATGQLDYPNKYGQMAESMFDMMDAFATAYQKRSGSQPASSQQWVSGPQTNPMQYLNSSGWNLYSLPGSFGSPSWMPGSMPGMGSMMGPSMPMSQLNPWGNTSNWMQGAPWSGGSGWTPQPGYGSGATPWAPQVQASPLDGSWQGNTGEVLTISQGRFRIYMSRDQYREGSISVSGNYLTMTPEGMPSGRVYEFAEQQGRLALRDETGNLLLYKRLQH